MGICGVRVFSTGCTLQECTGHEVVQIFLYEMIVSVAITCVHTRISQTALADIYLQMTYLKKTFYFVNNNLQETQAHTILYNYERIYGYKNSVERRKMFCFHMIASCHVS